MSHYQEWAEHIGMGDITDEDLRRYYSGEELAPEKRDLIECVSVPVSEASASLPSEAIKADSHTDSIPAQKGEETR
ncbi:MAG: hypothetical protein RLY20_887 [Verrucomicrobiota bacterium]|jgi:hypothetical protein